MLTQLLIICPLVFIAGFVDAVAGGGGLISLPAYMLAGVPVHNAIATNKLSSCMGTTLTTAKYIKSGFVPWKQVPVAIFAAFAGSAAGANIALMISDRYFKIMMLFIIPFAAFYVLKTKNFSEESVEMSTSKTQLITFGVAFVVGFYDGFYGPGTGTFLILLLTGIGKMALTKANGLSKVINLTTNYVSLGVYLLNGKVFIMYGLIAGVFGIAGNYIGAENFSKRGGAFAKPIVLTVLAIFFVKLITEILIKA